MPKTPLDSDLVKLHWVEGTHANSSILSDEQIVKKERDAGGQSMHVLESAFFGHHLPQQDSMIFPFEFFRFSVDISSSTPMLLCFET